MVMESRYLVPSASTRQKLSLVQTLHTATTKQISTQTAPPTGGGGGGRKPRFTAAPEWGVVKPLGRLKGGECPHPSECLSVSHSCRSAQ